MFVVLAFSLITLILVFILFFSMKKHRDKLYFLYGRHLNWPIKDIKLEEFDDAFKRGSLGPIPEKAEVIFLGEGDGIGASTSDMEAWILAVLSKSAQAMFEFGTCTGRTTYLWAKNSSNNAKIVTLTLMPDLISDYKAENLDTVKATKSAINESHTTKFIYNGTDVEHKITQIFSDSKKFDETPYLRKFDLIFVDGSHAYSYAKSDTAKAIKMLKPGGIILWHDYNPLKGRSTAGVYKFLNELSRELPLFRLRKTSLVAYRSKV